MRQAFPTLPPKTVAMPAKQQQSLETPSNNCPFLARQSLCHISTVTGLPSCVHPQRDTTSPQSSVSLADQSQYDIPTVSACLSCVFTHRDTTNSFSISLALQSQYHTLTVSA